MSDDGQGFLGEKRELPTAFFGNSAPNGRRQVGLQGVISGEAGDRRGRGLKQGVGFRRGAKAKHPFRATAPVFVPQKGLLSAKSSVRNPTSFHKTLCSGASDSGGAMPEACGTAALGGSDNGAGRTFSENTLPVYNPEHNNHHLSSVVGGQDHEGVVLGQEDGVNNGNGEEEGEYHSIANRLSIKSLGFGWVGGSRRGFAKDFRASLRSRLCEDLSLFLSYVTRQEQVMFEAKIMAFSRCKAVVRSLWPRAQVNLYGSFVTGLSLPWSDMDLVISLPKVRKDAPADTPGALEGRNAVRETWQRELARQLSGARWVDPKSIKIISHTAIPVIKLVTTGRGMLEEEEEDREPEQKDENAPPPGAGPQPAMVEEEEGALEALGGLTPAFLQSELPPLEQQEHQQQQEVPLSNNQKAVFVDISFEWQGHSGQAANRLVRGLIDEFEALRPLVLLLKQFLKERGLAESYTGGLSSYALTLMVTRYLQVQAWQHDSGSLLMGLLDFYGNHFDPRTTGISVSRRCYFSRLTGGAGPLLSTAHRGGAGGSPGGAPPSMPQHFYSTHTTHQQGWGGPAATGSTLQQMQQRVPYRFDPLFVEDPLSCGNNVGRNCFRIYRLQRAWSDALLALQAVLDRTDPGFLGRQPECPLLACFVSEYDLNMRSEREETEKGERTSTSTSTS